MTRAGGGGAVVQPGWLADAPGAGLVVVDVRAALGDPLAGRRAYAEAHIPGAIHLDLQADLSGPHAPGAGRHPWPTEQAFAATLARVGITPRHEVVAYDGGDGAFAARLWFLLETFGHPRAAVLDGGWARWQALGLPTSAIPAEPVPASAYPGKFDRTRLLDATGVQAALAAADPLVDARAAPRFLGASEPIDPVAGHIPGAINRPYVDNLRDGRFKPPAELAAAFAALLDGRRPGSLVASCGSGVTACHHLLAMAHAGLAGGRLYTGSWSGWIDDPSRPVEPPRG